jgi:phage tail P2-like protein
MNDDNKSLLPINASKLLKDLESSSLKASDLEALNRYITNPNLAPENILPWLAWAVSVDDWDDNWTLEVRRNVIRSSIKIHKKKGTIGALRSALEAFNYENITVEEWFNYGGAPHFFRVFFDVVEPGFDVGILPEVQKVINSTKNARSHLESLKAFLSAEMGIVNLGSAMISKEITPLPHFIYETDDEVENVSSTPYVGIFLISKEIVQVNPVIFDSDDELISQNVIMPAIGTFLISKEITTINPLI